MRAWLLLAVPLMACGGEIDDTEPAVPEVLAEVADSTGARTNEHEPSETTEVPALDEAETGEAETGEAETDEAETDEAESDDDTVPPDSRLVVSVQQHIGYHLFAQSEARPGPWRVGGLDADPEATILDAPVQVMRQAVSGCRTAAAAGTRVTTCPGLGVVRVERQERGSSTVESLMAIERRGVVHAAHVCDVLELLDRPLRDAACGASLRAFGMPVHLEGGGCRWRFTQDGPLREGQRRRADMTLRLAPTPRPPSSSARRWTAEHAGWTASVEVRPAVCGQPDGQALANALARLGPVPLPTAE